MSVEHNRVEQSPEKSSDPDAHASSTGDSSAYLESCTAADTSGLTLAKGRAGLIALLSGWDSLLSPIPEDAIRKGLEELRLNREALAGSVNFNERDYQRNLVHSTATYEVLILCWRSGQRSPIHDHGDSVCGLLVLEGVATEASFELNPRGSVAPSQTRRIQQDLA